MKARVVDGRLVLVPSAPEAKVRAVGGRLVIVAEAKALPKTQQCSMCKNQATKRVLWAEGMAYQPACDEHLEAVTAKLAKLNDGDVDGVKDISAAEGKAGRLGTPNFDEGDHPRDRLGKFVQVGGTVAIRGGGQGEVLETAGAGRIRVRKDDGTEVVIDAGLTTQIRSAEQNQSRAAGPAGLEQALDEDPDATPVPGERDDAAAEVDPIKAVDRPVGGEPAPDADPAGADAYLASPDGSIVAWLRTDEAETPVGYLRTDAADTTSTLRFADGATWAAQADSMGLDATTTVPASPEGGAVAQPDVDAPAAESDTPAAAGAPTRVELGPATASPEQVQAFLADGLGEVGTYREFGDAGPDDAMASHAQDRGTVSATIAAAKQAKAEVAANIASRMADVPDDVMLDEGVVATLAKMEGGEVVRLRMPGAPDDRLLSAEQWEATRAARGEQLAAAGVEVITADTYRREEREKRVAASVALWAQTSNGLNPQALAMQDTAAELFGMDDYAEWPAYEDYPELRGQVEAVRVERRAYNEASLLAQYEATQDAFREQGITEVQLFRGFRVYSDTPEWALGDRTDALPLRPLSSFSSSEQVAGSFARSTDTDEGLIVSSVVPVERILATPRSGYGSLAEAEFVVLAGPGEFAVRSADDRDGPPLDNSWDPIGELGDDEYDDEEDDFDPATAPAGFLQSREELLAAVAAAEDPTRRQALMTRAAGMGLAEVIPETWGANGEVTEPADVSLRGPDGRLLPMDDVAFEAHTAGVESAISRAQAGGLETTKQHTLDGGGEVWSPERAAQHTEIVDAVWGTAASVPNDGRALLAAGLPGANVAGALTDAQSGIDPAEYLMINVEDVKAIMAGRGMVPDVPDSTVELSPMERAALVHEEATHVAGLIALRAAAERKNVAWTLGLADQGAAETRLSGLRNGGYGEVRAVFVDIPVETSVARSAAGYRADAEASRNGEGVGGRYIPPAVIRESVGREFTSAPRAAFEAMRDSFDDWQVWDDSVEGEAPRMAYYRDAPALDRLTDAARTGTVIPPVQEKALLVPGAAGGPDGPAPAGYTDSHVYARDPQSGAGNCVCGAGLGDELHTEAAPGVPVPEALRLRGGSRS